MTLLLALLPARPVLVHFAVVNIAVLVLVPIVSTILLSIGASIGDTFHIQYRYWYRRYSFTDFFWQFSIPIFLLSDALDKFVNNITVTERVKTRTVVLHLK